MTNTNLIKQKVFEYIDRNDMTTYVEIEKVFEECGFDFEGDIQIAAQAKPALILWDGWNKEATSIIRELENENKIKRDTCPVIYYVIDGKVLNLPVAKNLKFKREHWGPVGFVSVKNNSMKEVR